MALFDIFKRSLSQKASAALSLSHPKSHESLVFYGASATWGSRSYPALVKQGMEENAIVQRCVRIIAQNAASVRWTVAQDGRDMAAHPLLDLLASPNPMQGGMALMEAVVSYLLLSGNGFLEKVTGANGRVAELYVLRPDRMEIVPGPNGWPAAYIYKVGQSSHRFPVDTLTGASNILHLKEFSPLDDQRGLSALTAAARAIDMHGTAEAWNKALLDNAARPSGALVFEPREGGDHLSDEQFARLKSEMQENFQGSQNVGRPMLLEGGLKWQPMALSPTDMDHQGTKNAAARDIALAFGVPPMLLGIPGDNTYANYHEASRGLWRMTLLPLLNKLVEALNRWLSPEFGDGVRIDYDRNAISALAQEREMMWRMVGEASFLNDEERRLILGLPARAERDETESTVP